VHVIGSVHHQRSAEDLQGAAAAAVVDPLLGLDKLLEQLHDLVDPLLSFAGFLLLVIVALFAERALPAAATALRACLQRLLQIDPRDIRVFRDFDDQIVDVVDLNAADLVEPVLGAELDRAGLRHLPSALAARVALGPLQNLLNQREERLVVNLDRNELLLVEPVAVALIGPERLDIGAAGGLDEVDDVFESLVGEVHRDLARHPYQRVALRDAGRELGRCSRLLPCRDGQGRPDNGQNRKGPDATRKTACHDRLLQGPKIPATLGVTPKFGLGSPRVSEISTFGAGNRNVFGVVRVAQ
jgi:hypothetical protein